MDMQHNTPSLVKLFKSHTNGNWLQKFYAKREKYLQEVTQIFIILNFEFA